MITIQEIEALRQQVKANTERYLTALDAVAELIQAVPRDEQPPFDVIAVPTIQPTPAITPNSKEPVKHTAFLPRDTEPLIIKPGDHGPKVSPPAAAAQLKRDTAKPAKRMPIMEGTKAAVEQVRKLGNPFTANHVAQVTGMSVKTAANFLLRSAKKDWVERVGVGVYKRTDTFGLTVTEKLEAMRQQIHAELDKPEEKD